jgi:hypothetical protein
MKYDKSTILRILSVNKGDGKNFEMSDDVQIPRDISELKPVKFPIEMVFECKGENAADFVANIEKVIFNNNFIFFTAKRKTGIYMFPIERIISVHILQDEE